MLELDRSALAHEAGSWSGQVWGVLIDIGAAHGSATVVALADNTTSMYTSTGGGIIGAGFSDSVAAANRRLLEVVEAHLADIPPSDQSALPTQGSWVVRALTDTGPRAVEVLEADLQREHPLWAVYRAAHGLITQLRLLDEARRSTPPA